MCVLLYNTKYLPTLIFVLSNVSNGSPCQGIRVSPPCLDASGLQTACSFCYNKRWLQCHEWQWLINQILENNIMISWIIDRHIDDILARTRLQSLSLELVRHLSLLCRIIKLMNLIVIQSFDLLFKPRHCNNNTVFWSSLPQQFSIHLFWKRKKIWFSSATLRFPCSSFTCFFLTNAGW